MAYVPKILAFAGSTRADSFNKKLVKIAAKGARDAGAEVTHLDLKDLNLPLFDEDLEAQAVPQGAARLKQLMQSHDGFLISSPEYNSSVSGVLKNAIDWASRPAPGEASLASFAGKTAVLMAASPGALGGLRGLVTLRSILGNIQVIVLPQQVAVNNVHTHMQPDGTLNDEKKQASIEKLGRDLAEFLKKHKS